MKVQRSTDQKILRLMLDHEHFGKIIEGKKSYDFRDLTDYWKSRLEGREYDAILFRNGYLPDAPEMLIQFLGCEKWSHSYAIKLGDIIELKRWPSRPIHHAAQGPVFEKYTVMQAKNPARHHTPEDDPEPGTPGTGEDICPECHGTGQQMDKNTGKPTNEPCERCGGTGLVTEGIG